MSMVTGGHLGMAAYPRISLCILLHGLVTYAIFITWEFLLLLERSLPETSLSPISGTPRFCHYCSEVWEQEVTGSFYPSTLATYSFYGSLALSGKKSRYNIEISQSTQNPHGLHEITVKKVTSHRGDFPLKAPQAEKLFA